MNNNNLFSNYVWLWSHLLENKILPQYKCTCTCSYHLDNYKSLFSLATLAFHNCLLYCTTHAPFRGIPFCCSNDDPPIASRHVQVNVELFNDQSGFILEDCQNVTCNPPYTNRHCSLMGWYKIVNLQMKLRVRRWASPINKSPLF